VGQRAPSRVNICAGDPKCLAGITYVTPQIRHAMEEIFIRDPRSLNQHKELAERQREVLQMLAERRSTEEIAYILYISHRTVRYHKYRIMEDLGLKNNTELVQYAIKHSIIPSR
jgi:DNA-binding NarL/FixJ family response regulator